MRRRPKLVFVLIIGAIALAIVILALNSFYVRDHRHQKEHSPEIQNREHQPAQRPHHTLVEKPKKIAAMPLSPSPAYELIDRIFGIHLGSVLKLKLKIEFVSNAAWCFDAARNLKIRSAQGNPECYRFLFPNSVDKISSKVMILQATGMSIATMGIYSLMVNQLNSSVTWGAGGDCSTAHHEGHCDSRSDVFLCPNSMDRLKQPGFSWRIPSDASFSENDVVSAVIVATVPLRYHYNYCTFGYTSAFWDWEDWEREIDWLALHGVNMPLALIGQEATWLQLWTSPPYNLSKRAVFEHFTGPGFWPWHWMGNLRKWGGPVTEQYVLRRKELQLRILSRMRELGMHPVLPAFAGHVPEAIAMSLAPPVEDDPLQDWGGLEGLGNLVQQRSTQSKKHGKIHSLTGHTKHYPARRSANWMGFYGENTGVYMLDPVDPAFVEIGQHFMEIQTDLYGTAKYYAADTFNEMPPPSFDPLYLEKSGAAVVAGITSLAARNNWEKPKWVVQGWLFLHHRQLWDRSSVKAYLNGAGHGNVIVLDLATDLMPLSSPKGRHPNFYGHDHIRCILHSFGGRQGVFGDPAQIVASARSLFLEGSDESQNLVGTGLSMEATHHNPVIYELVTFLAFVGVLGNPPQAKFAFSFDVPSTETTKLSQERQFVGQQLPSWPHEEQTSLANTERLIPVIDELPTPRDHAILDIFLYKYIRARYGLTDRASSAFVQQVRRAWVSLVEPTVGGPYGRASVCCPAFATTVLTPVLNPLYHSPDVGYNADAVSFSAMSLVAAMLTRIEAKESIPMSFWRDTTDILQQALDNVFLELHVILAATIAHPRIPLKAIRRSMEALMMDIEDVLYCSRGMPRSDTRLHDWESRSILWATSDGFPAEKALFNARNLITAWGNAKGQGYPNYAAKHWAGLFTEVYLPRWESFFNVLESTTDYENIQVDKIAEIDMDFCNNVSRATSSNPHRKKNSCEKTLHRAAERWLGMNGGSAACGSLSDPLVTIADENAKPVIFKKQPLFRGVVARISSLSWRRCPVAWATLCQELGDTCVGFSANGTLFAAAGEKPQLELSNVWVKIFE